MIDFHQLIVSAVHPVRVMDPARYLQGCIVESSDSAMEVKDLPEIITAPGEGCGVFDNPRQSEIVFFNIDTALRTAPRKLNSLPSACDFIAVDTASGEFMIAELTESKTRSLTGDGRNSEGKISKSKRQLCNTIDIINKTGFIYEPSRKSAIFFFKETDYTPDPAAVMMQAMNQMPVWRVVTHHEDAGYAGWTFYSHPYPFPYRLQ
ncbi:MAG: hypothetical protein Q4C37_03490 [Bacteroidales bacterium]|nr:hypothetical protein [Bacteroidales bacterium]